jgi:hypothetical protein
MRLRLLAGRRWPSRLLTILVLVVVLGAVYTAENRVQAEAHRAAEGRFVVRAATAAGFAEADASYTLARERNLATALLSSRTVTQQQFESFLQTLSFTGGLLLTA